MEKNKTLKEKYEAVKEELASLVCELGELRTNKVVERYLQLMERLPEARKEADELLAELNGLTVEQKKAGYLPCKHILAPIEYGAPLVCAKCGFEYGFVFYFARLPENVRELLQNSTTLEQRASYKAYQELGIIDSYDVYGRRCTLKEVQAIYARLKGVYPDALQETLDKYLIAAIQSINKKREKIARKRLFR